MPDLWRRRRYTESQIDYRVYKLTVRELIKYSLIISCIACLFAYVFYKSIVAFVIFILPFYLYMRLISNYLKEKRNVELLLQFREFCMSLCAQLITGYSLENAIYETYGEMENIYGKKSYICREITEISYKLKVNFTIEECFEDFAVRSGIQEIELFAEIIKIAKRTGGDIIEIVKNAADSISQKIEVEREIRIIINGKKQEQMVMSIVPLVMILYVSFTSPDMMQIVYEGFFGRIFMSVCLGLYIFAIFLGTKFSKIKM